MIIKTDRVKKYIRNEWLFIIVMIVLAVTMVVALTSCSVAEPDIPANTINVEYSGSGVFDGDDTDLTGIIIGDGSNISDTTELSNTTLNNCVGKGTWTNSGNWILPTFYLGNTVYTGGYYFNSSSTSVNCITTGATEGLTLTTTADGSGGSRLSMYQNSVSPANNDKVAFYEFVGKDSADQKTYYGRMYGRIENVTDGSECGKFEWELLRNGSSTTVMTLSSAGVLAVDDSYDTFDDYDDAELLRQGISLNDKSVLLDAGILINKLDDNGEIINDKYMIQFQPLLKLLAGGVYQNRDYIESLEDRIKILEERIK